MKCTKAAFYVKSIADGKSSVKAGGKDNAMSVSRDANYNPDDALQELLIQKRILECAIDIQSLLRILVDKGVITKDEMQMSRQEVRSSQKYKMALEDIERQEIGFKMAKDNPEEYLKALFKAKIDGRIK